MTKFSSDPFLTHRAALYPWRSQTYLTDLTSVLNADIAGFCDFLDQNGLSPLWSDFLQQRREDDRSAMAPLAAAEHP